MGVAHISFLSNVLGFHTNVYVILPTDARVGETESFCTLYLLHGGGGNALDWMRFTNIERYAQERHIAVVMPEVGGESFYADMKYGYDYFTYISEELPQVMEYMFPLCTKKEGRLVAGLSMGGYGAFLWALRRPDFFRAAANLSGLSNIVSLFRENREDAFNKDQKQRLVECVWGSIEELEGSDADSRFLLKRAAERREEIPVLFGGIGTEDFTYHNAMEYLETARQLDVPIHFEEMPGGHEWKVWDEMIRRFLDWENGRRL